MSHQPNARRRARQGEVAARVAVVLGLAAAAGLAASGAAPEAEIPSATRSACSGWVSGFLTAI